MTRIGKKRSRCCVKDCERNVTDSAFRFPMNELRCRLWLERCGNESLYKFTVKELNASKKVCQRHFAPHAFTNMLRTRLNFDAVPSIFTHSNVLATESTEEILQEVNAIPVPSSAKIREEEINFPVSIGASSKEISQEQCIVPILSSAETEEIPHEENVMPVPSSTEVLEKEISLQVSMEGSSEVMSQEQCYLPISSSPSTKKIASEGFKFPMPLSAKSEQIPKTQYYSESPAPVTTTTSQRKSPASPDEIIVEDALPVLLPAKTKHTATKNYFIDVPSSSPSPEEIIIEEDNFPVPLPENSEEILKEKLYSKVLTPNRLNIDAKLPNFSQKELPQLRNKHKQSFKNNTLKRTLPQSANITGNKMFVVANQSPVKPMNASTMSCGLRGCNNDLYSDAKITKKLVKCSSDCKRFFHLQCTGLEKAEYDILCKNDALRWFCLECRMTL